MTHGFLICSAVSLYGYARRKELNEFAVIILKLSCAFVMLGVCDLCFYSGTTGFSRCSYLIESETYLNSCMLLVIIINTSVNRPLDQFPILSCKAINDEQPDQS